MKIKLGGREIFYTTGSGQSDPSLELVLFVHGAGFDHSVWVMPSRYFARKGLSVFAIDLPGRGRSEGPSLSSIDLMADCLADFIGQGGGRANLETFIMAARDRGDAMDHSLLHGPPGLGKTTLAQIIAAELGVGFRATSGPVIARAGDLAA